MFSFILFLVLLVVIITLFSFHHRLKTLEDYHLKTLQQAAIPETKTEIAAKNAAAVAVSKPAATAATETPDPFGYVFDQMIAWSKRDFLMKLGAFLVVLAFGWFVSYAFLHDWIGPMGRITLGVLCGVALLLIGTWRIRRFKHQGGVFMITGALAVIMTLYAARHVYDFFTPSSVLAVMFLTVAYVTLVSVQQRYQALAGTAALLGGVAPLLVDAPEPSLTGLSLYLLALSAGTLWVVALTSWRFLIFISLAVVTLYHAPYLFGHLPPSDAMSGLLFSFVFTGLFFAVSILGMLAQKQKLSAVDIVTGLGSGLFLLWWVLVAAPEEWTSLMLAAWMIVFASGAFVVFQYTDVLEYFYTYAGVSLLYLFVATSLELSGPSLTVAYIIEAALLVALMERITNDIRMLSIASSAFALPMLLSLKSIESRAWENGILHKDFAVLALLIAALWVVGFHFFTKALTGEKHRELSHLAVVYTTVGSMYAMTLIWLSLHAIIVEADTATMLSLIIYTIAGVCIYVAGLRRGVRELKAAAGLIVGFVVGHLLLVEVWDMALSGRIITFFSIGALLMSTAFVERRQRTHADIISHNP